MTAVDETLKAEGWARMSGPIGDALYSKLVAGQLEFRDRHGKPCGAVRAEPEKSLMEEATAALASANNAAIAKLVMGDDIDKTNLRRLLKHMPLDEVLEGYGVVAIKRWLGRAGVQTKSNQKDQLVALVATALNESESES